MEDAELLAALTGGRAPAARIVLCTVVDSAGSVPQKPGARLAVAAGGRIAGTIGGGAIEKLAVETARAMLAEGGCRLLSPHLTRDLGMCCGGRVTVFLQTIEPAETLLLFGAGHIARPLSARAGELGFSVVVVDERAEWASRERFPGAARIEVEPPLDAIDALPFDARTSICVVTHDHRLDQEIVEACLPRPWRYLGVIGSRRKAALFRERLLAKGFPRERVEAIHGPMGLAIGAQTPEEIAISICAELIAVRHAAAAGREQAAPPAPLSLPAGEGQGVG